MQYSLSCLAPKKVGLLKLQVRLGTDLLRPSKCGWVRGRVTCISLRFLTRRSSEVDGLGRGHCRLGPQDVACRRAQGGEGRHI